MTAPIRKDKKQRIAVLVFERLFQALSLLRRSYFVKPHLL
jgi:hypothetical protein